jgi:AcrR family transcriptional regulator
VKSTKDKILDVALRLFNDKGISAVSSKHVSEELGISYGNLCYHFPRKDDIIIRLYMNMQEELDVQFKNMKQEIHSFRFMAASLKQMLEILLKYKFIYLGFTKISRSFEEVKRHLNMQFEARRKLLREILDFLIAEGYMRYERVPGHYDKLIHTMLLLQHAWIADAEVFFKGSEEEKIAYYLELFYSFIRSSLTQKGVDAFNEVYLPDGGQ